VNPADLALGVLPTPFCRAKRVLPLRNALGGLAFVVADPFDLELRDALNQASGLGRAASLMVATPEAITRVFDEDAAAAPRKQAAPPALLVRAAHDATPQPLEISELTSLAGRAPVVKLVNDLILTAIEQHASDIHIEPRERALGIRYRIDGRLEERPTVAKDLHAAITSRIKIMAGMDIAQHRAPQDGRILVSLAGSDVDLRVSTMPCRHGEKVVIRILDKRALSLTFDALGVDVRSRDLLRAALLRPHGLILVTGPTGSGKTTTLYTALSALNTPERNVVTVEDPVEYDLHRAMQVQVAPAAGLTFASALRSVLRQDPDVVMVGEIRDPETLDVALKASLTGHLVLSTLHTNDAVSTVARLHDMAPAYLVASALHLVVAQRLLRRLCGACKRIAVASEDAAAVFFEPVGCPKCRHTGYSGRIPVVEVMTMSEPLREIARRPVDLDILRAAAVAGGMRPLRDAALDLAAAGETSLDEVANAVGL
jgi:general secretion pathway protein E